MAEMASFLTIPVPSHYFQILLQNLQPGLCPQDNFVQGTVAERFPLASGQQNVLKMVLHEDIIPKGMQDAETAAHITINVYFFGGLAEEADSTIQKGSLLALTGFQVTNSPSRKRDGHFLLQLELSRELQSAIFVLPKPAELPGKRSEGNKVELGAWPPKQRKGHFKVYTYTPLWKVQTNMVVNIYGAVKLFKPPMQSKGPDHSLVLTVVDPSAPEGLRCVLFGSLSSLPPVQHVGDIVRFHRLKVQTYCSSLQGTQMPGFSALVFDGTVGAPIVPKSTSLSFSFDAEQEKEEVSKLRSWMLQTYSTSLTRGLMDVKPHSFLNLQCQLVAIARVDLRCSLLKVWDGTLCPYIPYSPTLDNVKLKTDMELLHRSKGLTIDIMVYDDHAESASSLQPGDFLDIFNLHATQPALGLSVDQNSEDRPRIRFVLHGSSAFGRGLKVLPEHSEAAMSLSRALQAACCQNLSDPLSETLYEEVVSCTGVNGEDSAQEKTETCMERRPGHYQQRITPLTTVLSRALLGKYRVRVKVVQYLPPQMYRCVKLFCPACQTLQDIPSQKHVARCLRNLAQMCCKPDSGAEDWCEFMHMEGSPVGEAIDTRHITLRRVNMRNMEEQLVEESLLLAQGLTLAELNKLTSEFAAVIPITSSEEKMGLPSLCMPFLLQGHRRSYRCLSCSPAVGTEDFQKLTDLETIEAISVATALRLQLLRHVYILQLTLEDATGKLQAFLCKEQAERFFGGLPADLAVTDSTLQAQVQEVIDKFCPPEGTAGKRLWLDCTLKSVHVPDEAPDKRRCFHIFDMVPVDDEHDL
uniref:protection of telomeres protein 1-like n=1 Tax=Myxine glutinosa TaxID=7769 RepID=UPI00358E9772